MVAPLGFNKRSEEKARWGLYKDAVYCFEQILEAAPYKIVSVWLLTFHLISHPSQRSKTWLGTPGEVRWTHKQCFPYDSYNKGISIGQPTKTYSSALCAYWMLSRGLAKSDNQ